MMSNVWLVWPSFFSIRQYCPVFFKANKNEFHGSNSLKIMIVGNCKLEPENRRANQKDVCLPMAITEVDWVDGFPSQRG